jgi:hypothetical protein
MQNSNVKRFCIEVFVFLIVIAAIIISVNYYYATFILHDSFLYKQEQSYLNYINGLDDKKVDYAFLGDSNTRSGINPYYIPGAFNFGTGAENYVKSYYKLDKIINKDKLKIKYVFLEIDPHTFSTRLTDRTYLLGDLWYYSKFIPYEEISKIREISLASAWIESNFPILGNGAELRLPIIDDTNQSNIYLGWLKSSGNFSDLNKMDASLRRYGLFFDGQERISNLSLSYFMKTISLAKKNNITVVFIKYPMTKEYFDLLKEKNVLNEKSNSKYYETIFKAINSTLDDYYYFDYQESYFDHPEYFADAVHMNYVGAEHLSKRLEQDLNFTNR